MFSYTSVSESVQQKVGYTDFRNPIKVLYNDPNPVLKDYQPTPCQLPELFKTRDLAVKEFPIRKDDVWIFSYQKTGSTWTAELITVLLNGMDFGKIEKEDVTEKAMLFE